MTTRRQQRVNDILETFPDYSEEQVEKVNDILEASEEKATKPQRVRPLRGGLNPFEEYKVTPAEVRRQYMPKRR